MCIKVIYILINISGGDHVLGSPLGGGINWRREKKMRLLLYTLLQFQEKNISEAYTLLVIFKKSNVKIIN